MQVLKIKGGRANLLHLAQEINKGVLLCRGFRNRASNIKAKARGDHPKVGDISGCLTNQCREHVSIAISLNT